MKHGKNFKDTVKLEILVESVVTAERPAPRCCDPSNSDFSDPGDSAEIEDLQVFLKRTTDRGKVLYLDITAFIDTDNMDAIERKVMEG